LQQTVVFLSLHSKTYARIGTETILRLGEQKIKRLFGQGSKNWWKTVKTIKFKV